MSETKITPVIWDEQGPVENQGIHDDFVMRMDLPLPEDDWAPPSARLHYVEEFDDVVLHNVLADDIRDSDD